MEEDKGFILSRWVRFAKITKWRYKILFRRLIDNYMIFNSFQFLWLFPIVFICYYAISYLFQKKSLGKGSNYLLLLLSYGLYMQFVPWCTLVLLWVTLVTYSIALFMSKNVLYKRIICWSGVILGILPLVIFKYYNFCFEI